MATVKTGNVSGLTISRNGGDFIFSWKQPSKWFTSWQKAWWSDSTVYYTKKRWGVFGGSVYITKGSEKRTSTWGYSSYWPSTKKKLTYVGICLQGCAAAEKGTTYTPSGYTYGWYYNSAPPKPTVTVETNESESFTTSFKWEVKGVSATSKAWCTCVYIWTLLVKNNTETDGVKAWKTYGKEDYTKFNTKYSTESSSIKHTKYEKRVWATSGTFTVIEDPSLINDGNSYTRWVCFRAQGPAGDSGDVYVRHAYSLPAKADITKWKVTKNTSAIGYTAQLWFNTPASVTRPVTNYKVQYGFATPAEGFICPDDVSWKDAATIIRTDSTGGALFAIDQLLSKDKCLFARVNSTWDKKETYGIPKMIDVGELKKPTITNVSLDSVTHKATIEATNNSEVPDSFMVVRFMTDDDPVGFDVAIIPHGETRAIGIQCPSWTGNPRFGLYAVAPADCYTISSGYDIVISSESSYEEGQVILDKDVFYEAVQKKLGIFEFTYKEFGDWYIEINSDTTIESNLISINEFSFYTAINGQFNTYSFVYYEELNGWVDPLTIIEDESESGEPQDITVQLKDYGIKLDPEYIPVDQDIIKIKLEPIACWNFNQNENEIHKQIDLEDYGITLDLDESGEGDPILPTYDDKIIITIEEVPNGVSKFKVNPKMKSELQTQGGNIPLAPESVGLDQATVPGTIRVTWAWSWEDADSAELSWADHEDAWESTDEPTTYTITKLHAASWNISGLEIGKTWYVRVRLIKTSGDNQIFGAYSDTKSLLLSSAPVTPVLNISDGVMRNDGQVTVSWNYSSTDGSEQSFAEVAEVREKNNKTIYDTILQVEKEKEAIIDAQTMIAEHEWKNDENHILVCRVTSSSGETSQWSNEVALAIAEPITCEITNHSLETISIDYPDDEGETKTIETLSLTKMPISVTIVGAKEFGITTLSIERASEYHVDRPDETDFNGYEGETIASFSQSSEDPIVIDIPDLIGRLDDGARYRLIASTQDSFGQSASQELVFEVHWEHQAMYPTVETVIDQDNSIAILKPIAPAQEEDILKYESISSFPVSGTEGKVYIDESTNKVYLWKESEYKETEDVCDIYRLSVDRPELIYRGATFGEVYVDPYPTIGEYGGHRYVTRTINDDYIVGDSAGGSFAWTDTKSDDGDLFEAHENIINFDDKEVHLLYEVDLSNAWAKDFKETRYLGGSVQGDWNNGVGRTGSLNVTTVSDLDQDTIQLMRRLAVYPGVCHIRSKDGSSYAADVQVNETYEYTNGPRLNKYDLSITRIDQESLDGMLYSDWINDEESQ